MTLRARLLAVGRGAGRGRPARRRRPSSSASRAPSLVDQVDQELHDSRASAEPRRPRTRPRHGSGTTTRPGVGSPTRRRARWTNGRPFPSGLGHATRIRSRACPTVADASAVVGEIVERPAESTDPPLPDDRSPERPTGGHARARRAARCASTSRSAARPRPAGRRWRSSWWPMLIVGWFIIRRDLRPLETDRRDGGAHRGRRPVPSRRRAPRRAREVGRLGHGVRRDARPDPGRVREQQRRSWRRSGEEQLRQFVADASHELRTPLTALRGYAELYRAGGLADDAALEQAMTRIGTESRRMATLVEDLLLLARLDQGRPLRRDPVDLSRLVERRRRRRAGGRARRGRSRPTSSPASWSQGDEDRLRQVVGNLFANVRVHTPPTTPVEVALGATTASRRAARSPTTDRASTRPTSSTSSTASTAPIRAARATAAAPAWGCRSRRRSSRRTAGRSATARRPAAGPRSW